MRKNIVLILLCLACGASDATAVMPWITPTGIDGMELEVYYGWSSRKIDFTLLTSTESSAGIEFNDNTSSPLDYISSPVTLKLSIRPELGFSPYVKIGIMSSEIKQTTTTVSAIYTKKWYSGFNGFMMGAGARYVLGGDSIKIEQIFLDIGVNYYHSRLSNCKEYNSSLSAINHSLDIWELNGSLLFNKALELSENSYLATYAGGNIVADYGRWNVSGANCLLSGNSSSFHIITGFKLSVKSISIQAELSLIDGFGVSGGINYEFGYYN